MNLAIIPAAGSGTRIGGPIPKQFIEIAGAPILAHTIRRFYECPDIHAIAVALPADKVAEFRDRDASVGLFKPVIYVSGGQERSDSILNALDAAAGLRPEIVAVHDAVRPFVTPAQIAAVIAGAKETGAAILALPATDTIKEVEDGVIVRTLDRRRIYRAQTPQAFGYELLRRANEEARAAGLPSAMLTDDSLLVERLGHAVAVVEGSASNIKITTPEDLLLAQKMFEEE
ncbi:MAG TPA: 2-C-methyl-D-erythritol 4-phosphate cytidylyltransferase [Blastocatellia bacterium]|nr:2-C-methyl-D-erythritol 4-phosphate cytidylyltransferase [Blastocatellia bacterium]